MRGVIVLGAGGHAKVCIDLLRAGGHAVDYCIGAQGADEYCVGVPILHGDEHLQRLREQGYDKAFVAIGDNRVRQRLADLAGDIGFLLVNAISPQSVVSPSVRLGSGVAIMAGAVVNADSVIGDLAIINTLASVDHDGVIGNAVHIAPHVGLAGNVSVGTRSFLGIGSKVLPQITIGSDVMVAAGSVIISDVESGSKVAGVPAKAMRQGQVK